MGFCSNGRNIAYLALTHFLSSGLLYVRKFLQALGVVGVLDLAGRTRHTASGASVAHAAALSPLGNGASASSLGGSGIASIGGGPDGGGECRGLSSSRGRLRGGRLGSRGRSSSLAGGSSTSSEASVDGRAGNGVARSTAVDVEKDTRAVGLVDALDVDAIGDALRSGRSDLDLAAAVVELGLALVVTLVEGNDLGADEVVALNEVGNGHIDLAGVAAESLDGPLAATEAGLLDLDPGVALALSVGLGNPDDDGALVGLYHN